ncbi:MAG: glycosidase, partial [Clostridiales bacterium]|nr:glycosidase [Clostridiales bacterium]
DKGWLEIYHGADKNNRYSLGVMLLDLEEPWKIVSRYELPILEPEESYEREGFFSEVVFTCGAILEDGMVRIYYGACDNSVCECSVKLDDLLALFK